jgi:hypothetical protein
MSIEHGADRVRVVLMHGPLDGLRIGGVPNESSIIFIVNLGGVPHAGSIYFDIPPAYRSKLWDVGVYRLPKHPYQSDSRWVFEWIDWAGKKPAPKGD